MKAEATAAALVAQSAMTATAAVAFTEQWWFAVVAACVGALLAVHSEGAYLPGEIRRVVGRAILLTGFSWLIGVHVCGIESIPLFTAQGGQPVANPLLGIPAWVRSGLVGIFSPYLHALLVSMMKRRTNLPAQAGNNTEGAP